MYCSDNKDTLLSVIQSGHTALIKASCEGYTEVVNVVKVNPNITDKVNLIIDYLLALVIMFHNLFHYSGVTLLLSKLPRRVIPAQSRY